MSSRGGRLLGAGPWGGGLAPDPGRRAPQTQGSVLWAQGGTRESAAHGRRAPSLGSEDGGPPCCTATDLSRCDRDPAESCRQSFLLLRGDLCPRHCAAGAPAAASGMDAPADVASPDEYRTGGPGASGLPEQGENSICGSVKHFPFHRLEKKNKIQLEAFRSQQSVPLGRSQMCRLVPLHTFAAFAAAQSAFSGAAGKASGLKETCCCHKLWDF